MRGRSENCADRENAAWLSQLHGSGVARETALSELRTKLVQNLRRALGAPAAQYDTFIEDTAQEALIRILERIDQFEGRSRFLTWATSIAIRIAMSDLRRKRWQEVSLDALLESGAVHVAEPPSASKSVAEIEQMEVFATLQRLIDSVLTARQRTALLAELKGMPQDEIARQLGSNRNAIYKLNHDARKSLKRGLEAAGYARSDISGLFPN